jgi:predicted PurR-regulated permease PerM
MNNSANGPGETGLWQLPRSSAWWLFATSIAVALILGLGTLAAIRLLALPLAVLILSLTLAAALEPVVSWLGDRIPRLLAIIIVYLVVVVLLGGLLWVIIPTLVDQIVDLANRIPELIERSEDFLNRWNRRLPGDTITDTLMSHVSDLSSSLLRLPLTISTAIFGFFLILFLSFYVLLEISRMEGFLLSLFPAERRTRVREIVASMGDAVGGYVRGSIINGVIVGFLVFFGLLILNVDFAIAFGVLAGILELIPTMGPIIATIVIVGLTLLQSPGQALAVLIFLVVLQQVENHILVPNIMRSQTCISPLTTILALFAGGAVGGLIGALVAIPIAAALRVFIQKVVAPAIRGRTGADPVEGKAD